MKHLVSINTKGFESSLLVLILRADVFFCFCFFLHIMWIQMLSEEWFFMMRDSCWCWKEKWRWKTNTIKHLSANDSQIRQGLQTSVSVVKPVSVSTRVMRNRGFKTIISIIQISSAETHRSNVFSGASWPLQLLETLTSLGATHGGFRFSQHFISNRSRLTEITGGHPRMDNHS